MTILTKITAGAVATAFLFSLGGAASANTENSKLNSNETTVAKIMTTGNDKFAARISNQAKLLLQLAEKEGKPFPGSGAKIYANARKLGLGTTKMVKNLISERDQSLVLVATRHATPTREGRSKFVTSHVLKYGGDSYVSKKSKWTRADVNSCKAELRAATKKAEQTLSANYREMRTRLIQGTREELSAPTRYRGEDYAAFIVGQVLDYQDWAIDIAQEALVTHYLDSCGGWELAK
jgi:hypothetical protein